MERLIQITNKALDLDLKTNKLFSSVPKQKFGLEKNSSGTIIRKCRVIYNSGHILMPLMTKI